MTELMTELLSIIKDKGFFTRTIGTKSERRVEIYPDKKMKGSKLVLPIDYSAVKQCAELILKIKS